MCFVTQVTELTQQLASAEAALAETSQACEGLQVTNDRLEAALTAAQREQEVAAAAAAGAAEQLEALQAERDRLAGELRLAAAAAAAAARHTDSTHVLQVHANTHTHTHTQARTKVDAHTYASTCTCYNGELVMWCSQSTELHIRAHEHVNVIALWCCLSCACNVSMFERRVRTRPSLSSTSRWLVAACQLASLQLPRRLHRVQITCWHPKTHCYRCVHV